jgi:hypothetical protein
MSTSTFHLLLEEGYQLSGDSSSSSRSMSPSDRKQILLAKLNMDKKTLDFSENPAIFDDDFAAMLANLIKSDTRFQRLERLNLSGSNISDRGILMLTTMLKSHKYIQTINFSGIQKITTIGVRHVADLLIENLNIQKVNLENLPKVDLAGGEYVAEKVFVRETKFGAMLDMSIIDASGNLEHAQGYYNRLNKLKKENEDKVPDELIIQPLSLSQRSKRRH